jgi:acyl-CoA hydrolase
MFSGSKLSRIVPMLDAGTIVTVPRIAADTVIAEFGIAKLKVRLRDREP